eukprot:EG_transcript_9031
MVLAFTMRSSEVETVAILAQPQISASGTNVLPILMQKAEYSRAALSSTVARHSTAGKSFTVPEFQASGSQAVLPWMGALFASVAGLVLLWQKAVPQQRAVGLEEIVAGQHAMFAAVAEAEEAEVEGVVAAKPKSKKVKLPHAHFSKRRRALETMYQRKQLYPLEEALRLAKETSSAKFTESIDVAVNLGIDPRKSDQMVRGSVVLPAGTGKVIRVAAFCQGEALDKAKAAGAEFCGLQDLAELIKGGELGFDVVVATPDAMRVALQLGKILGPRGLMPNPKDGTVNVDIEQAIRNAKAGQVKYRSDKAGTIHCPVGKTNFDIANLKTNVNALLKELMKVKPATVKGLYMKKVVVSSSMGPGIYVDISTTDAAR